MLTRRVPLVEQKLLTIQEHITLSPLFSGVRVAQHLFSIQCVLNNCLSFCVYFILAIVSSVHRFKCSDYPFSIFKHCLDDHMIHVCSVCRNCYDTTEIYLKVALNTITLTPVCRSQQLLPSLCHHDLSPTILGRIN